LCPIPQSVPFKKILTKALVTGEGKGPPDVEGLTSYRREIERERERERERGCSVGTKEEEEGGRELQPNPQVPKFVIPKLT
jgi:hypothetical protein